MFGRPLRTQLDIMKPNRRNEVLNKQAKMLSGGRERHLQTGQEVMVRDYRRGGKWTRGTVHTQTGPRTYQVQVSPDIMWRRHINQMHSTENCTTIEREQAQSAPESDTQGTVEDGGAVETPGWKKGTCWWRCCYSRRYNGTSTHWGCSGASRQSEALPRTKAPSTRQTRVINKQTKTNCSNSN